MAAWKQSRHNILIQKYVHLITDNSLSWKGHTSKLKKWLCSALRKFYFLLDFYSEYLLINLPCIGSMEFLVVGRNVCYKFVVVGKNVCYSIKVNSQIAKAVIWIISRKCQDICGRFWDIRILPLRHMYIFKILRFFYIRSGNKNKDKTYDLRKGHTIPIPWLKLIVHQQFYVSSAPCIFYYDNIIC